MFCKYCNQERKESDFQKAVITKDKVYYRKKCTYCKIDRQNERKLENRNWLREFKKTLYCNRCNFNDYRALQFHHINSEEKENTICQGILNGWSKQKLQEEINKCEILCANCHFIEHFNE
jgi:hypothetical protein